MLVESLCIIKKKYTTKNHNTFVLNREIGWIKYNIINQYINSTTYTQIIYLKLTGNVAFTWKKKCSVSVKTSWQNQVLLIRIKMDAQHHRLMMWCCFFLLLLLFIAVIEASRNIEENNLDLNNSEKRKKYFISIKIFRCQYYRISSRWKGNF